MRLLPIRTHRIRSAATAIALVVLLAGCSSTTPTNSATTTSPTGSQPPGSGSNGTTLAAAVPIAHVLVINLENKGYDQTWGSASPATYLTGTLRPKGELLTQYFGTAHNSLGNYIAQISGQGPNPATQIDCPVFAEFEMTDTADLEQAIGKGCLYPAAVSTLANQLEAKGKTWKGYMEDLDNPVYGAAGTCRHPEVGQPDASLFPKPGAMYAAKHNPFVYFRSIIDTPSCAANVVGLDQLDKDLAAGSLPNYGMITPNQCNDGHDKPCADKRPGGLVSADEWLKLWVPKILESPGFKVGGLLIITFDEAEQGGVDASNACCGQIAGPNVEKPGITGPGGGRVGALLLGAKVKAGSTNDVPYNHYALLCSIEDLFGLDHLGYAAQPGLTCFGKDVYNSGATT